MAGGDACHRWELCLRRVDGRSTLKVSFWVRGINPLTYGRNMDGAVVLGIREFKLPWREAGPINHHDDIVDSDQ